MDPTQNELSTSDGHAILSVTKTTKGYTWKAVVYQKPNETEEELRTRLIEHDDFLLAMFGKERST